MPERDTPSKQPVRSRSGLDLDDPALRTAGHWVAVRHVTAWRPPTDVYQIDDQLVVEVEIAGMREGDFNVVLQSKKLIISGVRKRTTPPEASFHQLELAFGEFRTEVSLPWQVERTGVSATYRDGFLRIVLPHVSPRTVRIVNLDESAADHDSGEDN